MATNNSRSSLPVLQLQPSLKPLKTILKSTAAKSAKLELAHVYSSKQDWPLLGENTTKDSQLMLQNEKPVSASSTSYSKYTGRQDTGTHDENPMSFSFMYDQTSGLENISVDDINVSLLAHDGSEISSDPSFNGLQSQDRKELRSKRGPKSLTKLMQNNTDAQSQPLTSSHNDQANIDFMTPTQTAILAQLAESSSETEEKAQDNSNNENSFELSFDTSRGHGAVFSSSLRISPELFPDDHNTILNRRDSKSKTVTNVSTSSSESELIIDLEYVGAEAESGAAPYSSTSTNSTTPDPTPTATTTSNNGSGIAASTAVAVEIETDAEINSCGTNPDTIDLDLTNLALAKRGNPENLYGLLAGFITTGKKSRNPITINLNQCYNCDGTCVRNTIAISSSSKSLKVTNNGIQIPETPSGMQQFLNPQNSSNLNGPTNPVDPQWQSNPASQNQSNEGDKGGTVLNFNSNLLTELSNIIKPAVFSPYNQISCHSNSVSTPVEPERLLTTSFSLPSQNQISQMDLLNQSAQLYAKNIGSDNTFLVSKLTDLDRSNVQDQDRYVNSANAEHNNNNSTFVVRNSSFQDQIQIQEGEIEQQFLTVVDTEISPITKPGSKKSDAKASVISIPKLRLQQSSISKRKRGVKRSKRRVLKTKIKKLKVQSNSTLPNLDSASVATPIQSQRVLENNIAVSGRLLVDSTSDSLAAPLLSPHTSDVSRFSPINQNSDDAEIEEDTSERVSDEQDLSTNYLDLYHSKTKTNSKNPKVATLEYSCSKCSFRTMSSVTVDRKLKDHFKRHQIPSKFECSFCCRQYSAISSTTRHILTCHKNPHRSLQKPLQSHRMKIKGKNPLKHLNLFVSLQSNSRILLNSTKVSKVENSEN